MTTISDYLYRRLYRGPVKALILDWSGTLIDPYVIGPAFAFVSVFRRQGVAIGVNEARGPMGLRKDEHIRRLLDRPEIAERWREAKGRPPKPGDIQTMYDDFADNQLSCLHRHSDLIPGVKEACLAVRKKGVKIGVTTGFTRAMIDIILKSTAEQGFVPDASVGGDEVINGTRPAPNMLYRNLDLLDVHPIQAVVKVDDTPAGIEEGCNAGCWTVGVSRYANAMDIDSPESLETLSQNEIHRRHERVRHMLIQAGAHYVIDSLADIQGVIDAVEARLAKGETP